MVLNDAVILEFLEEHDLELAPKGLYRNLNRHGHDIGYSTVRNRVRDLEEHGLLSKDGDGYYEVSDRGRAWLRGDLPTEELEDDEESDR